MDIVTGSRSKGGMVGARSIKKVASVFAIFSSILASTITTVGQGSKPLLNVVFEEYHDVSLPLRTMVPTAVQAIGSSASASTHRSAAVVSRGIVRVATVDGLNFDGVKAQGNYAAPDPNGAVGDTQYMQWANSQVEIFDKTSGSLTFGPVAGGSFWSGFNGPCGSSNDADGIVNYDKAAARWVVTHHAVVGGPPYYQCVAVSTTSDATGSYNRYAFRLPINNFPDYPKIGIWPDAYYMAWQELTPPSFVVAGELACALDRSNMILGSAATAQCFEISSNYGALLPSDLDGATAPPAGSPDYFLELNTNSLNMWQFHADFQTPSNTTFTGPANIPVNNFVQACSRWAGVCVLQPGSSAALDSLSDRLMYRLAYRNFGDHEALVVTHSVAPRAGIRWYEIRSPGSSPTIFQQGTYSPDRNFRWMGSIAMDKVGDIAVGYSVSSATIFPSIRYTGRIPTDPLGAMEAEKTIFSGAGSQPPRNGRWGDYTSMSVDPSDDCTFWYTNEYLAASGSKNWSTRIASFKFANCQ